MLSVRLLFATAAALAILPAASSAADLREEYEQVRKIAFRDRKVQEAFDRANERLDERIVALDPALASYVRAHPSGRTSGPTAARPAATPAKKPAPAVAKPRTHKVAAGETVSSIAARYGVSPDNLQGTNRIRDARKLKVGQVLVVPR